MPNSNWEQGFFKGILREEDGTPSFARTGSLLLVVAVIVWISHIVIKTHSLPDLTGPASFLTTNVLSLYGVNKGVTATKSILGQVFGGSTPTPPAP